MEGLGGLPRVGDVLQLQFYLGALGVEWGCLDYVDRGVLMGGRGGCVDVSFRVRRDRGVFEGLVHRAILLESFIGVGEVPAGERCWLCRYGGYREGCREV